MGKLYSAKVEKRGRWLHDMERFVMKATKVEVEVGYFGHEEAKKASINEYGTADGHIPERSFIRPAFTQAKTVASRRFAGVLMRATPGDPVYAMVQMGEVIAGQIRRNVLEIQHEPNAPSTVEKKGHNIPLVEVDGDLLNKVQVKVRRRG